MSKNEDQKLMEKAHAIRSLFHSQNLKNLYPENLMEYISSLENTEEILKQVRSQEKGIPSEYQFGAICWWLGKCKHFQFIDTQPEFPYLSKIENVKYPDAFAIFNYNNSDFPCFIQIKSNNNRKLKLSSKYVTGLKKYPLLKDYPLLIAWKYHQQWFLFDIDTFISESGGINVKFEDAGKANLMGILCGDFVFSGLKKGIETYFALKPDEIELKNYKKTKDFNAIIMDFCLFGIPHEKNINESDFFSEKSQEFSLIRELGPFLGLWEHFDRFDGKYIYIGERVSEANSIFASQVLPYVFYYRASINQEQNVDWKGILKNQEFKYTIDDVAKIIQVGRKLNIGFERVIHFLPGTSNPCID